MPDPISFPTGAISSIDRIGPDRDNSGIYLGSLDAKPEQQSSKRLLTGGSSCGLCTRLRPEVQAADTSSLLAKARSWPRPFDLRRLELAGEAVPIAEGMGSGAPRPFSASMTGVLAYRTGEFRGSAGTITQLTWFDRAGKALGTVGEPGLYNTVALSPDGTRVAVSRAAAPGPDGGRPAVRYLGARLRARHEHAAHFRSRC